MMKLLFMRKVSVKDKLIKSALIIYLLSELKAGKWSSDHMKEAFKDMKVCPCNNSN